MGVITLTTDFGTTDYFFVGPDNGVLALALETEKVLDIRRLENRVYFRQLVIVSVRDIETCEFKKSYQDVPAGQPVAVVGSTGLLEIAVNGGRAVESLGLKPGDPVSVRSPVAGKV